MSILVWMKCFSDLCFYFSLFFAFPRLFPAELPGILIAALLSLGVFWMALCEDVVRWYRFRRLGLVCPAICLCLWVRSVTGGVLLLPPCLYAAVLIVRGRIRLQYYDYRLFFRRIMIPWVILFVMLFTAGSVGELIANASAVSYRNMLYYGAFSFVTGVVLLRGLRMGLETDLKRCRGQLTELAAALGGVGLAAWLIRTGGQWLLRGLRQVGLLLMIPWTLLLKAMSDRAERMEEIVETAAETGGAGAGTAGAAELMQGDTIFTRLLQLAADGLALLERIPWKTIFVVLLAAAAVGMLGYFSVSFFFHRSYRSGSSLQMGKAAPEERKARSRRRIRRSNREKVRAVYREYLKLVRRNEIPVTDSMTSRDVLDRMQAIRDRDEAVRLREIYLAARYQEQGEITGQQVTDARAALQALKNVK